MCETFHRLRNGKKVVSDSVAQPSLGNVFFDDKKMAGSAEVGEEFRGHTGKRQFT